jgi:hypothetical protein
MGCKLVWLLLFKLLAMISVWIVRVEKIEKMGIYLGLILML